MSIPPWPRKSGAVKVEHTTIHLLGNRSGYWADSGSGVSGWGMGMRLRTMT
jgi:hypothetical protein